MGTPTFQGSLKGNRDVGVTLTKETGQGPGAPRGGRQVPGRREGPTQVNKPRAETGLGEESEPAGPTTPHRQRPHRAVPRLRLCQVPALPLDQALQLSS